MSFTIVKPFSAKQPKKIKLFHPNFLQII